MTALYVTLGALGALLLLSLLILFLIAPARGRKARRREVLDHIFAHRGFFDNANGVPENSMSAFRRAVEAGYGIETDIHLSRDGVAVLHHDDSLKRICGVDALLREKTAEELSAIHLLGTEDTVPRFSDFLRLVDGKVPLVLELKEEAGNSAALVARVMKELEGYEGPYCIESFDPRVLYQLRKQAPSVIRGQLAGRINRGKKLSTRLVDFALSRLLFNVIARPDFVAYRYGDRDIKAFRLCTSVLGATRVYWTLRSRAEYDGALADGGAPIFEGFVPEEK